MFAFFPINDTSFILIPFVRTKLNEKGEVINTEIIESLKSVVTALIKSVQEKRSELNTSLN